MFPVNLQHLNNTIAGDQTKILSRQRSAKIALFSAPVVTGDAIINRFMYTK